MANEQRDWIPDWAVAPGEILQESLEERGISQTDLAHRMGRPVKTINEIVNGKAAITPDTAIQLELALGISRAFWNRLEVDFREHQASARAAELWLEDSDWAKAFPLAEMRKRNLVPEGDDAATVSSLLSFFGVASPEAWEKTWPRPQVAFRRQEKFEISDFALATWLREGEQIAEQMHCEPFDASRLDDVIDQVRALTTQEPVSHAVSEATDLLATAGVALVLLPEYPKLPVSGAACCMSRSKARIQLTLRFKRDDSFWFSLFHECGHLRTRRGEDFVEWEEIDSSNLGEELANAYARDALIPPSEMEGFLDAGDLSPSAVRGFARTLGISVGIVVGRLQNDGVIAPKSMNSLKRSINWG